MENKKITVVVDAMGGENAPYKNLKGSEIFLKNKNDDVNLVIIGDELEIKETIKKKKLY